MAAPRKVGLFSLLDVDSLIVLIPRTSDNDNDTVYLKSGHLSRIRAHLIVFTMQIRCVDWNSRTHNTRSDECHSLTVTLSLPLDWSLDVKSYTHSLIQITETDVHIFVNVYS